MSTIEALAASLEGARRSGAAIPQLTLENAITLSDAYAIQHEGLRLRTEEAGEHVSGLKLGLTSKAKAEQMGVEDVIVGTVTDAMAVPEGNVLDLSTGVHPRVEPEVAFRVAREVDLSDPQVDLLGAVDAVAPALEVIDSRYKDFRFTLEDVVADNTSASRYVLGPWSPSAGDQPLAGRTVSLTVDREVVATGTTSDILDDPWEALPTTARLARTHGHHLPAGSVLLAGAATAAVTLQPGTSVVADIEGLGTVMLQTKGEQ